VPAGVIGGRIYHVISSFCILWRQWSSNRCLQNLEGGLGIWGAISLCLIGLSRQYRSLQKKINLPSFAIFADALAPGIVLAQAIGRFCNWFNGELFGRPLYTWWALEVPTRYRPFGYNVIESFHRTFI